MCFLHAISNGVLSVVGPLVDLKLCVCSGWLNLFLAGLSAIKYAPDTIRRQPPQYRFIDQTPSAVKNHASKAVLTQASY